MRVLVVNDRRSEREAVVRALQKVSCHVEQAADAKGAVSSLTGEPCHVIVAAWGASGGPELLRVLRTAAPLHQAYVIALLEPTPTGADIPAVLAAGAHDFVRRPIVEHELVARVRSPGRIIPWSKAFTTPDVFDFSSTDISRLMAWRDLGRIVAHDTAQIVGRALEPIDGWPAGFDKQARVATIQMSAPSDKSEIRLSIAADDRTSEWLGTVLLGDPAATADAIDDVLREMVNTAGGALKRAALPENLTLTTGLPSNGRAIEIRGDTVRRFTLPLEPETAALVVAAEIRVARDERVAASSLREGMVLVNDVRNEAGVVLVTAGTRLTATAAERLRNMLGGRFVVDVLSS